MTNLRAVLFLGEPLCGAGWILDLDDCLQSKYAVRVSHSGNFEYGGDLSREEEERLRLAANYAGMSDGELLKLAAEPESLTELAWDALEDEIDRRRLEIPEPGFEIHEKLQFEELVTIRKFRDLPEALLAKGSLESAGIPCFLADENVVRLDWLISNFIGGAKLQVREADAENARKLLDEPILEGLYVKGIGLYEQPRCPQCKSLDVNLCEVDPISHLSAFLAATPSPRAEWRCQVCGVQWKDSSNAHMEE